MAGGESDVGIVERRCRSGIKKRELLPDAELLQLRGNGARPIFVRRGTGRTGMKDLADLQSGIAHRFASAFNGEVADSDEPMRFKNLNDFAQVFVANGVERGSFGWWEF